MSSFRSTWIVSEAEPGQEQKRDHTPRIGRPPKPSLLEIAGLIEAGTARLAEEVVRRGRGRPDYRLTQELAEEFVSALLAGNYVSTACDVIGVSRKTFRHWISKGKKQRRGKYREFLLAIREALARGEAADVALVNAGAVGDWKAAAFKLEHRWRKRWGQKSVEVKHSLPGGHPDHLVLLAAAWGARVDPKALGDGKGEV